jgi:hypothetical protein
VASSLAGTTNGRRLKLVRPSARSMVMLWGLDLGAIMLALEMLLEVPGLYRRQVCWLHPL